MWGASGVLFNVGENAAVYNSGSIVALNTEDTNDPLLPNNIFHSVHLESDNVVIVNSTSGEIIASGLGKAGIHIGNMWHRTGGRYSRYK